MSFSFLTEKDVCSFRSVMDLYVGLCQKPKNLS